MIRWNLIGFGLSLNIAAAWLAGCSGSQPPIGATGATAQASAFAAHGDTSNYKVLYRFLGEPDGAIPYASLADLHGTLYGTTVVGGTYNVGTVFSISTSGTERVLHSFGSGSDGTRPVARLIDVKGTLYGTTRFGGTVDCVLGCGTVFSVGTSGAEKVLYNFKATFDGDWPAAGLIGVNGTLYGTTSGYINFPYGCDSAEFCGTVFSLTRSGQENVLHNFGGPAYSDGANSVANLIDVNGTLYGTTEYGGVYYGLGCEAASHRDGCGTVFSITTSGKEKVLHSFGSATDGSLPVAALTDVKGTLYGTTYAGGKYGKGTVFSISTSGSEKVLHSFGFKSTDAAYPAASLIEVGGTLYGTTSAGGEHGLGTVFSMNMSGAGTVLHNFAGGSDGAEPNAALLDVGGVLYGTTTYGGAKCKKHRRRCGTVFALSL